MLGRLGRLGRLAAALVVASGALTLVAVAPASAKRVTTKVSIQVVDVSPATPNITTKARPLTIQLALTNITDTALHGITVAGLRGDPISSAQNLDAAMAEPRAPSPINPITTKDPVTLDLAAGATQTVDVVTTTSTINGSAGICICTRGGVYPLYFTATVGGAVVGSAQTYLPAFYEAPPKEEVTWIWPLVDRPHRVGTDQIFTDDDLAASVAGGRLDRALQTLETLNSLAPGTAITVMLDPELLDELVVMATTKYTVQRDGKPAQPGTGHDAAVAWLSRLHDVLDADPNIELALTPYADPDYESVTRVGLQWTSAMPPAMQGRVTAALGQRLSLANVAWPVSGSISRRTATALAASGLDTVLLASGALPPSVLPVDGSAVNVRTGSGDLSVLSGSKDLDAAVASAVAVGGSSAARQQLTALAAVRVADDVAHQRPNAHHILLAPDRDVDPSPDDAAAAIIATTSSFWSQSAALPTAVPTERSVSAARLSRPTGSAPALPDSSVNAVQSASNDLPSLVALFGPNAVNPVVTGLPAAIQRAESAAWTDDTTRGAAFAHDLVASISQVKGGVFIVKPKRGPFTLTLASTNAPLPLTVENDLDEAVRVIVRVQTVNGLPLLTVRDQSETIDPHSKLPIHLKTKVVRSGRTQVEALLLTTTYATIGTPVTLSVHSTALGLIGLIITFVAGAVLLLLLLRRFWTRFRRRGATKPEPVPAELSPEPAA